MRSFWDNAADQLNELRRDVGTFSTPLFEQEMKKGINIGGDVEAIASLVSLGKINEQRLQTINTTKASFFDSPKKFREQREPIALLKQAQAKREIKFSQDIATLRAVIDPLLADSKVTRFHISN